MNNIKKMFEKKYNIENNYNKIIQKSNRITSKKNIALKYSLIPICLILIVCSAVYIKTNINNKNIYNNEQASVKKQENYIDINKIDEFAQLKLDADLKTQEISSMTSEFDFLNNLSIPNDLHPYSSYLVYIRKDNTTNNYDLLHDYVVNFESDKYYNEYYKKSITIAFSKEFKPLRDYYIDNDNSKVSKINNIETIISNYNDMYMVSFTFNNINYDVETFGITQTELISLLNSITKSMT